MANKKRQKQELNMSVIWSINMRYAGIIYNDISAAPGVCVSLYVQGCPFHCKGCHNPETWDFDGGYEFTPEVLKKLLDSIEANGVHRSLCILGGEPLHPSNISLTSTVILSAKAKIIRQPRKLLKRQRLAADRRRDAKAPDRRRDLLL